MPSKVELQQQLLQIEKKLSAETAALDNALSQLRKLQEDLDRLRKTQETADEKFKDRLGVKASELEKEISYLLAEIGDRHKTIAGLQAEIDLLQREIDNSQDIAVDDLFAYAKKVDALNDKFPVLLFPVRPETRFHLGDTGGELWIRIHPDTCHTAVQRQYLTLHELTTAIDYLRDNSVDIGARHGVNRAKFISQWIAQYAGDAGFLHDLQKGDRAEIKTKYKVDVVDSTPPPQALTLPDRFVFRLYNADGTEARTVISNPVPAAVLMGFDANTAPDKVAWMHNFDEAIKIGLGIKIPLKDEEYKTGFSKLVVLGIRVGTDTAQSQSLLENLLQDHLCSGRGLSFIKQGTITNNADDESTTFTLRNRFDTQGKKPPAPPPPPTTPAPPKNTEEGSTAFNDALWLSQYLGIDDTMLQQAENAQGTDQRNARNMNTALFPATLGYYLSELMDPLLTDDEINRIESFFSKYVLGRGTVPALRIGKQPYGILPVSVVPRLNLQASDPLRNAIVTKVQELFSIWKAKSELVKHISNENAVSTEDFIDILSLHPNSVSFQQRLMEDVSYKLNALNTGLLNPSIMQDLNDWMEEYYLQTSGMLDKLNAAGLDANTQRPDILYKMFTTATQLNGPVIEPVKDADGNYLKEVFSETEGLQFNYINWLATSDFDTIRNEKGVPYERKPLLYLFLRHAMLLKYAEAARNLEKTAYAAGTKSKYQDNQLVSSPDQSKTALLYKVDERITGSRTLTIKDYIRGALEKGESGLVELLSLTNLRAALQSIANLPTAKLERAFVEHIDCCTYRIDAWINALYSIQLRKQRLQADDTWSKGIYLGAFAYLEDLKPKDGIKSQGYILAPSMPHAAAGAILRNAQLTYQGNEQNPFNLDISSERVRTALQLLDNIRNGLSLNELLGYRFERALHESHAQNNVDLDKYIYDFRVKYPLAQSQNTQENDGPQETISARNVVDGSKLLAAFEANENSIFDGITIITAEQDIIKNIVRQLQDIIDAVKDLMMTEGVYQTVYSNYDRGSAVLDSLGQGKFMPDLEVVNSPRTGNILTHRVALHLTFREPSRITDSVRAALEPSINEWLYSVLPDPLDVVVNVHRTANDPGEYISQKELGIEPIDLLYLMNSDESMSMKALDDLIMGYLAGQKVHSIKYKNKPEKRKYTFFELAALVRPLRKILFQSRYLSANDVKFTTRDSGNEVNRPTASHRDRLSAVAEMLRRIDFSYFTDLTNKQLTEIRQRLSALSKTISTLFDNQVSLGAVFEKLLRTDLTPAEIIALKKEITDMVKLVKDKVNAQFAALASIITKVNTEVNRDPATGTPYTYDQFMNELKAALGENVLMVPQFYLPATVRNDYRSSFTNSEQLLDFSIQTLNSNFPTQDWMGGVARVREKVAAVESVMNAVELIKNTKVYCIPVQMPYKPQDRWLATQFTTGADGFKASDKLLYTIISEARNIDHGTRDNDIFCGFVIDDWTEVVPAREEKAGLSFQYTKPNAEAPQAMLLMTPPQLRGNWSHEDMLDSIISTFDVVKARAVEPDHLNDTELSQFIPATIMFSPLYDTSISTNLAQNN